MTTTGAAAEQRQPEPRPWQPMSLTNVGTFGDVMLGNTGAKTDGGSTKKK